MKNLLAELEAVIGSAPVDHLPELLGQLERLKGQAWARMMSAASTKNVSPFPDQQLLTLPQVAERLSIPESRAYELARQHKLPAVRIGKYVRVPLGKLQEYEKSLPRL
jgi:excisionase family DNA binding protein